MLLSSFLCAHTYPTSNSSDSHPYPIFRREILAQSQPIEVPRLRKAAPKKAAERPPPAKEETKKGFGVQLKKSKPSEKPSLAAPAPPSELPKLKKVEPAPKPSKEVSENVCKCIRLYVHRTKNIFSYVFIFNTA